MHVSFSKHPLPTPENLALWNKMLFIIPLRRDHNTTITPFSFLFLQTPTHTSKSSSDWTITKSGACQMVSKEPFPTLYSLLTHQREIYPSCIWSKIIKINSWLRKYVCNTMKRGIMFYTKELTPVKSWPNVLLLEAPNQILARLWTEWQWMKCSKVKKQRQTSQYTVYSTCVHLCYSDSRARFLIWFRLVFNSPTAETGDWIGHTHPQETLVSLHPKLNQGKTRPQWKNTRCHIPLTRSCAGVAWALTLSSVFVPVGIFLDNTSCWDTQLEKKKI